MMESVHTWMEPEADQLIMENISKNLADQVGDLVVLYEPGMRTLFVIIFPSRMSILLP
jgi:hypothetical protein